MMIHQGLLAYYDSLGRVFSLNASTHTYIKTSERTRHRKRVRDKGKGKERPTGRDECKRTEKKRDEGKSSGRVYSSSSGNKRSAMQN